MNRIDAAFTPTCYHYQEFYWMIDGKPIVQYLDDFIKEGCCPLLESMGKMTGLLPAWTGNLIQKAENQFIWELIKEESPLNVPILVCEDDCDLSCIVIVVHIRKSPELIYWDKIGLVLHDNYDAVQEQQSGILCLEAYTEEDWEKYGDNIATESYNSREYWDWVSAHWEEETLRQYRNYIKPYLQQDENIFWIKEVNWSFSRQEYEKMVEKFHEQYQNLL